MDYAEQEAYGITQQSTQFLDEHLKHVGFIVRIDCFLAGDTHTENGEDQWTAFVDAKGNRIVVSGFSWGYRGTGPHGLLRAAQKLGFDDLDIDTIARYSMDESWSWKCFG